MEKEKKEENKPQNYYVEIMSEPRLYDFCPASQSFIVDDYTRLSRGIIFSLHSGDKKDFNPPDSSADSYVLLELVNWGLLRSTPALESRYQAEHPHAYDILETYGGGADWIGLVSKKTYNKDKWVEDVTFDLILSLDEYVKKHFDVNLRQKLYYNTEACPVHLASIY